MENHSQWNTLWQEYQKTNAKKLAMVYDSFHFDRVDRGAKVLDLGCGSGEFVELLRRKGFRDLEGWEPQEDLVRQSPTGLIRVGNCLDPQGKTGCYDVIVMIGVLHHLRDFDEVKKCISNLRLMLKDGGLFYSAEPRKTWRRSLAWFLIAHLPERLLPGSVRVVRFLNTQEQKEFDQWLGYEEAVTEEFLKAGFTIKETTRDWRYRFHVFQNHTRRA